MLIEIKRPCGYLPLPLFKSKNGFPSVWPCLGGARLAIKQTGLKLPCGSFLSEFYVILSTVSRFLVKSFHRSNFQSTRIDGPAKSPRLTDFPTSLKSSAGGILPLSLQVWIFSSETTYYHSLAICLPSPSFPCLNYLPREHTNIWLFLSIAFIVFTQCWWVNTNYTWAVKN